ncbi:MAG TPA: GNAT family N-acetyltransferase [Stellaceae bacterium]|nr:GNAT family N-acetyltransferase [Stellaceae bacterium]
MERVTAALPAGFDALRAEARRDGHRMLDTLAAEWERGTQRFVRPGEQLLIALVGDVLAGIGGVTLEPAIPGALRMRRFYVALAHRRAGVGRALATTLLDHAAGRAVTANAAAGSEAFWEALGFARDRRDGRTHIRLASMVRHGRA